MSVGKGCLVNKPSPCLHMARWQPSVLVTLPGNDNKFRLDFVIPVCEDHKKGMTLKDVVPETTLKKIQQMFHMSLSRSPTYEDMTLEWRVYLPDFIEITDTKGNPCGKVGVNGAS